jgi:hypothetical protein
MRYGVFHSSEHQALLARVGGGWVGKSSGMSISRDRIPGCHSLAGDFQLTCIKHRGRKDVGAKRLTPFPKVLLLTVELMSVSRKGEEAVQSSGDRNPQCQGGDVGWHHLHLGYCHVDGNAVRSRQSVDNIIALRAWQMARSERRDVLCVRQGDC